MTRLQDVALGVAIAESDWQVREEGGNNRGDRVSQYLRNTDPPITVAAPWCAAFVQYCADVAADAIGVSNPLDAVKREALVADYVTALRAHVEERPEPGDLVAFKFGRSGRWNHVGFVLRPPDRAGIFWTVEGNTSDASQRDGDGVYSKPRTLQGSYPVRFIRWGPENGAPPRTEERAGPLAAE